MSCKTVQLEDGARAIVCSPARRKARCISCGKAADLLCDWKVKARRSGACDAPICTRCTHVPAPGKDLCPAHRDEWQARRAPAAPGTSAHSH